MVISSTNAMVFHADTREQKEQGNMKKTWLIISKSRCIPKDSIEEMNK